MIPTLIYQTWKSKTSLPENFAHWRASFARLNPGYTLLLWDDADNRQFIADHFAWFLPTYDGFPQEIFRVDAVRYFFLYLHGGIYVDLDTQCLKPLEPLRSQADRAALAQAVAEGLIDVIDSNHTPVDDDAKAVPFAESEPGATGLESGWRP